MSSIVLKSLSILLGLFFIFVGTMKVTPLISKDLHKDLVSEENVVGQYLANELLTINCELVLKWSKTVEGSVIFSHELFKNVK